MIFVGRRWASVKYKNNVTNVFDVMEVHHPELGVLRVLILFDHGHNMRNKNLL
jgi:hypothetical protein